MPPQLCLQQYTQKMEGFIEGVKTEITKFAQYQKQSFDDMVITLKSNGSDQWKQQVDKFLAELEQFRQKVAEFIALRKEEIQKWCIEAKATIDRMVAHGQNKSVAAAWSMSNAAWKKQAEQNIELFVQKYNLTEYKQKIEEFWKQMDPKHAPCRTATSQEDSDGSVDELKDEPSTAAVSNKVIKTLIQHVDELKAQNTMLKHQKGD